jgi:hypothetical protein
MSKTIMIIIGGILLLAAVAAGSFYGGVVYAQTQAASLRAQFFANRGGSGDAGGGGGFFGGGGGGGGGNGGGAGGQIKSINGNTIVLSTAQSEVTVIVSDSTQVMKLTAGTLSDLKVGDRIAVRGTRDASGNIAATVIQPQGNRGGGGQPTPTAAP